MSEKVPPPIPKLNPEKDLALVECQSCGAYWWWQGTGSPPSSSAFSMTQSTMCGVCRMIHLKRMVKRIRDSYDEAGGK